MKVKLNNMEDKLIKSETNRVDQYNHRSREDGILPSLIAGGIGYLLGKNQSNTKKEDCDVQIGGINVYGLYAKQLLDKFNALDADTQSSALTKMGLFAYVAQLALATSELSSSVTANQWHRVRKIATKGCKLPISGSYTGVIWKGNILAPLPISKLTIVKKDIKPSSHKFPKYKGKFYFSAAMDDLFERFFNTNYQGNVGTSNVPTFISLTTSSINMHSISFPFLIDSFLSTILTADNSSFDHITSSQLLSLLDNMIGLAVQSLPKGVKEHVTSKHFYLRFLISDAGLRHNQGYAYISSFNHRKFSDFVTK